MSVDGNVYWIALSRDPAHQARCATKVMDMDQETLFTATKWEILKLLEKGAHAPLEITKALGLSTANVSQQLRMLELAGLVVASRVPNRDKDQPRVRYRLAGNLSYVIAASDGFVDKRMLALTERNKIILRVWFIEAQRSRDIIERAVWAIEDSLHTISMLTYAGDEGEMPVLEYAGAAQLPSTIGTAAGKAIVRRVAAPRGHVLMARDGQ
jgi:DNA-binding HxlR family transcriptional regulator